MRMPTVLRASVAGLLFSGIALAQATTPTMPVYSGSFGGGLALTGGNTDTKNFNLTFNLLRDPKKKNIFKVDALYLRGSQNDILNLNRAAVKVRDEYTLTGRTFLFAEMGYFRDPFKDISYLLAPVGGIGYRIINNDRTLLSVSGGAGGFLDRKSTRLNSSH